MILQAITLRVLWLRCAEPRVHNRWHAIDDRGAACVDGHVVVRAVVPDRNVEPRPVHEIVTHDVAEDRPLPSAAVG